MQNGYHTAKVEWIKDDPIPEEQLGNLLHSVRSVMHVSHLLHLWD